MPKTETVEIDLNQYSKETLMEIIALSVKQELTIEELFNNMLSDYVTKATSDD